MELGVVMFGEIRETKKDKYISSLIWKLEFLERQPQRSRGTTKDG
jgi:hypothetical protein